MSHQQSSKPGSTQASVLTDEMAMVLGRAFASMASEVNVLTQNRPDLREAIHVLASGLADATQVSPTQRNEPGKTDEHTHSGRSTSDSFDGARRHATLKIGSPTSAAREDVESAPRTNRLRYSDVTDDDLGLIVERLQLKAEGARWAVEREERQRDGDDFATQIRPGDQDIIQRAKSIPHCFLWMNQPRSDVWTHADDFLLIGDCFDTTAEALLTLQATLECNHRESFRKAIDLLAEAQSALRISVSRVEDHPDSDQQMIYHWLRNRAGVERFYIDRYMRITDPADPERCDDVSDECAALRKTLSGNDVPQTDAVSDQISLQILDTSDPGVHEDDSLDSVA